MHSWRSWDDVFNSEIKVTLVAHRLVFSVQIIMSPAQIMMSLAQIIMSPAQIMMSPAQIMMSPAQADVESYKDGADSSVSDVYSGNHWFKVLTG
jgi:hypothetical protein